MSMIPHAFAVGDITKRHMELFEFLLEIIDSDDLSPNATCHDVCEYISRLVPAVEHVRGWFVRRGFHHSWLMVRGARVLIDAYPIAGAMPFIVSLEGTLNPWKDLYIPFGMEEADRYREYGYEMEFK